MPSIGALLRPAKPKPLTLKLPHHVIELRREEQAVVTHFADGTRAPGCPLAAFDGAVDDHLLASWQHTVAHCVWAEMFLFAPSPVLWAVAHGMAFETGAIQDEERRVVEFQQAFLMRS